MQSKALINLDKLAAPSAMHYVCAFGDCHTCQVNVSIWIPLGLLSLKKNAPKQEIWFDLTLFLGLLITAKQPQGSTTTLWGHVPTIQALSTIMLSSERRFSLLISCLLTWHSPSLITASIRIHHRRKGVDTYRQNRSCQGPRGTASKFIQDRMAPYFKAFLSFPFKNNQTIQINSIFIPCAVQPFL